MKIVYGFQIFAPKQTHIFIPFYNKLLEFTSYIDIALGSIVISQKVADHAHGYFSLSNKYFIQ